MTKPPIIETGRIRAQAEEGFSLLETLVALMIMAIASLALFQSTTAMLSLSDRAVSTAERTLENTLDRRAIEGLLSGLIPAWKEEEDTAGFTGTGTALSGVTSQRLSPGVFGAARFTLSLEKMGNDTLELIYRDDAQTGAAPQSRWVLQSPVPAAARFAYQDHNNAWHDSWPPPPAPASASPANNDLLTQPPVLPLTIALRAPAAKRTQSEQYIFQTPVARHAQLPPRDRI